jgi:multidrug resistance protein, MATE family
MSNPPLTDRPALVRPAMPLVVMNLATVGAHFLDSLMVAPLGDAALAAIFPASILIVLFQVTFAHILTGVTTLAAQAVGRGDPRAAGHIAVQGLLLGAALGLILLLSHPLRSRLFLWWGLPPEVARLAEQFFAVCLFAMFPALLSAALAAFFTAVLRTRIVLLSALAGTALNILLNYLLIEGRHGLPALGIAGAAWGTLGNETAKALILLLAFLSARTRLPFHLRPAIPDLRVLLPIIRIGIGPAMLVAFDIFAWGVLITAMIARFGEAHLAANTIAVRYVQLAFMPPLAIGAALTAVVGQCIGAGRHDLAESAIWRAFRINAIYMVIVGVLFLFLSQPLLRLFTSDPTILHAGTLIFYCIAAYQAFDAMYLTFSMALRGAGDTLVPALIVLALASTLLVGGGLALTLLAPQLASLGPWIATTVYTAALGLAMLARFRSGRWKSIRL